MPSSFLIHQILGENSACFINMHLPLTRVCGTHPYEGEDVCFWNTQYQTCIFPSQGCVPHTCGTHPYEGEDVCFWNTQNQTCIFPSQGCVPHTCGIHTLMRGKMYVSETRNIFSKLRDCLFLQTCYTCNRKKMKETNQRKARMDSMMCMTCIFIFF